MQPTATFVPVQRAYVVAAMDMLTTIQRNTREGSALINIIYDILSDALIDADEAHVEALRADKVCIRALRDRSCPLGHTYDMPDGLPRAAWSLEAHEAEDR